MSRITLTHESPKAFQRLRLEGEGRHPATVWLKYESLPKGVSVGQPEFMFFASLIIKGWEGIKLINEFAELALEEAIPSELSREKLKIWLAWFATEVEYKF